MYYRYLEAVVRGVAHDARSLLDVGTANAEYLESFDWIPRKVALDKRKVYSSATVEGIVADFFAYEPKEKFDLVTCFQVLEHVPDAGPFARRLFELGRDVLISVPFKWKAGDCEWHVHDPVDSRKLRSWTGRKPHYSVVASEIFTAKCSRRLIAYYSDPEKDFKLSDAKARMLASAPRRDAISHGAIAKARR
jgi:hypothetical protein